MDAEGIHETNEEQQNVEADEIFTIEELANYLKCSTGLIDKEKNKGSIPYLKIGNCVRFEKEQVLKSRRKNTNEKNKESE